MYFRKLCLLLLCAGIFTAKAQHQQVQQALALFSPDSLEIHVRILSGIQPVEGTDTIRSRYTGTVGNERSARYIIDRLLSWGLQVDSHVFSSTGKNIIATIPGTKSGRYIMMGAHYDAVRDPATLPPGIIFPGADDNASGVAAVLESARVLSKMSWPYSIKLALWDEEEQTLVGSMAYTPLIDHADHMGYINMDMIAYDMNNDSLFEIHSNNISHSNAMVQRTLNVLSAYQINLVSKIVNPGDPATDHQSFWVRGLAAIGINEQYSGGDFNPHWHSFSDSITYFNMPYFHKMSKLVMALTADCAYDSLHPLALNDVDPASSILVYPNPARQVLHLDLPDDIHAESVTMTDAAGKKVYESRKVAHEIDLTLFSPGIYMLGISLPGQSTESRKVVIY